MFSFQSFELSSFWKYCLIFKLYPFWNLLLEWSSDAFSRLDITLHLFKTPTDLSFAKISTQPNLVGQICEIGPCNSAATFTGERNSADWRSKIGRIWTSGGFDPALPPRFSCFRHSTALLRCSSLCCLLRSREITSKCFQNDSSRWKHMSRHQHRCNTQPFDVLSQQSQTCPILLLIHNQDFWLQPIPMV